MLEAQEQEDEEEGDPYEDHEWYADIVTHFEKLSRDANERKNKNYASVVALHVLDSKRSIKTRDEKMTELRTWRKWRMRWW